MDVAVCMSEIEAVERVKSQAVEPLESHTGHRNCNCSNQLD